MKLFKISKPKNAARGDIALEKIITIVNHSQEVICASMHGKLCATIAKDNQLIINQINAEHEYKSLLF